MEAFIVVGEDSGNEDLGGPGIWEGIDLCGHPGEETDSGKGGEGKEEEDEVEMQGVQEEQEEEGGPGNWEGED